MRKSFCGLIILLFALCFSQLNYANTIEDLKGEATEAVTNVVDNVVTNTAVVSETERIIDKYSSKVTEVIKGLATALEVPAEFVYEVLVKQQLVNSITYTIVILLLLITPLLYIKSYYKWVDKNDKDSGILWFLWVISTIIPLIAGSIMFLTDIGSIVMGFVNPDYGAIKDIIEVIK